MEKPIGSRLNFTDSEEALVSEFMELVQDILHIDDVQELRDYVQHCKTTRLQHCVNVAYYTFLISRRLNLNVRSATRGALLHDFYLYYVLRFGFGPSKIFRLAKAAFAGRAEYPDEVLYKWLRNFYWRFFAQQFKRSCLPDGPKVGSVTLSPRGDWRMPSDAAAALWLAELEQIPLKG